MRGAPQIGLSRLILRIRSRTCFGTVGRPGFPRRTFQVQNNRKPFRCQPTTVSGLTITRALRQSPQTTGGAGDRGDQPNPSGMGELLCGGAFEPVLFVCQGLGRKEDSAASDAGAEAEGLRLA